MTKPLSFPKLLSIVGLAAAAACCSSPPKTPTGPAPEYEDPPAPSWWKDGGAPGPAPAPMGLPPGILDAPPPPPAPTNDAGASS